MNILLMKHLVILYLDVCFSEHVKTDELVLEEKPRKNGQNPDADVKHAEENESAISEPEKIEVSAEETKDMEENFNSEETSMPPLLQASSY